MENKTKLIGIIETIVKEKTMSEKDFTKKIAPVLIKTNDSRKINSLITDLWELNTENIKDEDVESLLLTLKDYEKPVINTKQEQQVTEKPDEDKEVLENNKITQLYNEALLKIKNMETVLWYGSTTTGLNYYVVGVIGGTTWQVRTVYY